MQSFIREYLENRAEFLYENFTFIIQFSSMVRMVSRVDGEKTQSAHCTQFAGVSALQFAFDGNHRTKHFKKIGKLQRLARLVHLM